MNDRTPNIEPTQLAHYSYNSYLIPPPPPNKRRIDRWVVASIALSVLLLFAIGGMFGYFVYAHATSPVVGNNQVPVATPVIYTAQSILDDFSHSGFNTVKDAIQVETPPFSGAPYLPDDMISFTGGNNGTIGQMYIAVFSYATQAIADNDYVWSMANGNSDVTSWRSASQGRCWLVYPWNFPHAVWGNFVTVMDQYCV